MTFNFAESTAKIKQYESLIAELRREHIVMCNKIAKGIDSGLKYSVVLTGYPIEEQVLGMEWSPWGFSVIVPSEDRFQCTIDGDYIIEIKEIR